MNKCHNHVLKLAPHLIENKVAFERNDKRAIEMELRTIFHRIDTLVYNTHTIDALTQSINDKDFPLADVVREFYFIVHAYLSEKICRAGDRDFSNIIRTYLCEKGARNLVQLYHFIANVAIIKLGCTRIYMVDKSKKGQEPHIITDNEFLLQHVLNTSYRLSKSKIEKCIETEYKNSGLSNLLIARILLTISRDFRSSIKDFCPIIYKNWPISAKYQHEEFEKWLNKLIGILDIVIKKCRKAT
jgi:hypothetical protein